MIFNLFKLVVNNINACIINDDPMPDSNDDMYECTYIYTTHPYPSPHILAGK